MTSERILPAQAGATAGATAGASDGASGAGCGSSLGEGWEGGGSATPLAVMSFFFHSFHPVDAMVSFRHPAYPTEGPEGPF